MTVGPRHTANSHGDEVTLRRRRDCAELRLYAVADAIANAYGERLQAFLHAVSTPHFRYPVVRLRNTLISHRIDRSAG